MYKKIIFCLSFSYIFSYSILCFAGSTTSAKDSTDSAANAQQSSTTEQATNPADKIEFLSPWARASLPPNNNSAVYLTIKNTSNTEYTLIGAGAMDVANNVELHQSFVDEKGVSKMTAIDKIIIPANSEIVLQPAGMHIMLLDLKKTLKAGDKFKLSLKFLTIGAKIVDVEVKANN